MDYELKELQPAPGLLVDQERLVRLLQKAYPGVKIMQIKTLRELTGYGLKEAKDIVDLYGPYFAVEHSSGTIISKQFKTEKEARAWRLTLEPNFADSCNVIEVSW